MKKVFTLFLIFFSFLSFIAQKKEQIKDTIRTEIVNVITEYNPKIANAKKIQKNPIIKVLEKNKKKKLKYTISPATVVSTFIPKSGVVKGIDVGIKERLYTNYVAAGFGNYSSPYYETFLHQNTRLKNEFGLNTKYIASQNNITNSVLNSTFSNFNLGAFYKKQDRYFDWKVSLNSERNLYNWYGLPDIPLNKETIDSIDEKQLHNYFDLVGEFNFEDSYLDWGKIKTSYFTDRFKSNELFVKLETKLKLPLTIINSQLNDISVKSSVEFLKGKFKNSAVGSNKYSITTIDLNPQYKINYKKFILDAGMKFIASLDSKNNANNIFILPNFSIQRSLIKNHLQLNVGFSGDLYTNTYKGFTEKNPYVSPTLFITQTLEKSNFNIGFNGKIINDLNFQFRTSFITEEDKPLFVRNDSSYDGTNNSILNGYEYGNSFKVYYDDVKTTSIFSEIEYDYSKEITFSVQGVYHIYTPENSLKAWNLPNIEASFSAKYRNHNWFTNSNIFYSSERQDLLYSGTNSSETLQSFVDINVNGGYHFNDKFTLFLKLNNLLNTNYQRFANFNTQGFQALGGFTYKFDF
ncbi:MAG: hypothetical protein P8H93_02050 [Polaribacter sp.]|nr:hypothetical protein [Polaribacter sp.]